MGEVAALIEALKALTPQAPPTLHTPSFDWSSRDQYDNFQLFVKSVNSWFLLQGVPTTVKEGEVDIENPIRLDYVLNFLGNQGRQRYDHWTPTGADAEGQKKKASAFLVYLQSMMDHEISIRCRIYKLEETRIQPGESPDELVDRLRTLADRCNFPSEDEKERNVQYRLVRALDDRDLVKKLLALPIKETTAKMLEVCRTHIAINGEMEAMGLGSSKTVHVIQKGPPKKRPPQRRQQQQQHSCGNCTVQHTPGRASCPAKDAKCHACGKIGHWKRKCRTTKRQQAATGQHPPQQNGRPRPRQNRIHDVGTNADTHCDEVRVATVLNEVGTGTASALNEVWAGVVPRNQAFWLEKTTTIDEVKTTGIEAFARIEVPADIGKNQLATLKCKVDTGAGGNVMPIHTFAKLFPERFDKDGNPTGLSPSSTRLTAYNGSPIKQFGTFRTHVDWTPKNRRVTKRLHTQWYVADTPGPAILGLPSCTKLNIITLNCAVEIHRRQPLPNDDIEMLKDLSSRQDLIDAYPDRFEGIGRFPGTYHITLREDARPVVHA